MFNIKKIKKTAIIISMIGVLLSSFTMPDFAYAKENKSGKSSKEEGENKYFDLKPLYLSAFMGDGRIEHISLLVSLEIKEGDIEKLETYRSRLADAYIRDLYGAFSDGQAMTSSDIIDVEYVHKRLITITKDTLGDKYVVKNVLLQVLQ